MPIRFLLCAVTALLSTFAFAQNSPMIVDGLRCELRVNPIGIDARSPRFSWRMRSHERGRFQASHRVLVASDVSLLGAGTADMWDSGDVSSAASVDVRYEGRPLESNRVYFWKVIVRDDRDRSFESDRVATFETGLLSAADWRGRWVNDGRPHPKNERDFYGHDPAPIFEKDFDVPFAVRRARLFIGAVGWYEAEIDGERVGDHRLDPAWTRYDRRTLYAAHDIGGHLRRSGTHRIGVTLGKGFADPLPLRMWGHLNLRDHLPVFRPALLAQIEIEGQGGEKLTIASDDSWTVRTGRILFDNVYLGEIVDARRDVADAASAPSRFAAYAQERFGPIAAQAQPPVRARERITAVRRTEPSPGVFLYDMGRNFAGTVAVTVSARPGRKIVLRYGELLTSDGALNPLTSVAGQVKTRAKPKSPGEEIESVGGPGAPLYAWQKDEFIARGDGRETFSPRFTFRAFRYLEVTGLDQAPVLDDVVGIRMHADIAKVGRFECSNELLNRIQEMCERTFRSNLFGVQSDCPHRERFGYGGDIVATAEAMMMNFDMSQFYAKAVDDWSDAARDSGELTDTAPFVGIQYCGVGWGMAHPLLLRELRRYYGMTAPIEKHYVVARRYLEWLAAKYPSGIVTEGLGDHESLAPVPSAPLLTALFFETARIVEDLARSLGKTGDAASAAAQAEKIRAAWMKEFFDAETGRVGPGTQASQSFALALDLLPRDARRSAFDDLIRDLEEKNSGRLTTGIFGTNFMLDTLAREGRADAAYRLATRREFPGWGHMLENGATTLWEHWELSEDTFSHNHPMFGSISRFFFQWLGGIRPAQDAVGCDKIEIFPRVVGDLTFVRSSYESVRGEIVSNWRRSASGTEFEIEIPGNTHARVRLPMANASSVTEGGRALDGCPEIRDLQRADATIEFHLVPGRYLFRTEPQPPSTVPKNR